MNIWTFLDRNALWIFMLALATMIYGATCVRGNAGADGCRIEIGKPDRVNADAGAP